MFNLKVIAAAVTLAVAGSLAGLGAASDAEAAAPKCKPSVGTSNKFQCTTDLTAKPRPQPTRRATGGTVQIKQIKPKFKVKGPPCWTPNHPSGC